MSYKSRYGSTSIRPGRIDNLDIGWDFEDDETDKRQRKPVFLFTPDMKNTVNHHHIELSRAQAKKLRDWLTAYLKDTRKRHGK